jgi:probable HAF family extracellular repeat protein
VTASHAVLWQNGTPIDLGNLGGVSGNIAFDINNQVQVVGQSDLPGDTTHHTFLWENGVMTDLGTILGLPVGLANGINNKGQVAGFSQDLNSNNTVAWLWAERRDDGSQHPHPSRLSLVLDRSIGHQ